MTTKAKKKTKPRLDSKRYRWRSVALTAYGGKWILVDRLRGERVAMVRTEPDGKYLATIRGRDDYAKVEETLEAAKLAIAQAISLGGTARIANDAELCPSCRIPRERCVCSPVPYSAPEAKPRGVHPSTIELLDDEFFAFDPSWAKNERVHIGASSAADPYGPYCGATPRRRWTFPKFIANIDPEARRYVCPSCLDASTDHRRKESEPTPEEKAAASREAVERNNATQVLAAVEKRLDELFERLKSAEASFLLRDAARSAAASVRSSRLSLRRKGGAS
jgi:hypothetical protein